jgi:hypothetical protein
VGFFFPRVTAWPMAVGTLLLGIAALVRIGIHRKPPPGAR